MTEFDALLDTFQEALDAAVAAAPFPEDNDARIRLLTPTNGYVWRGQVMGRGMVWSDAPAPMPGETCRAGSLDMISTSHHTFHRHLHPQADFVEVPHTMWGDYSGTMYERANHEALLRDHPDTFVVCQFDYGQTLLLPLDKPVDADLLRTLEAMRDDYPVYDEQAFSQLEWDLAQEEWDTWLGQDTLAYLGEVLLRHLDDDTVDQIIDTFDVDARHPASLHAEYYRLTYEQDEYPHGESATSIRFPQHKQVVEQIASRPYALQVRVGLAARFPWLVL